MSKFYKQVLMSDVLDEDNTLVTIKKSLRLVENSEFYEELLNLFKISKESNEIIPIVGLNILINSIINKDNQFKKLDYKVNLCNVSLNRFTDDGAAVLNLLINGDQLDSNEDKVIIAETAYSARSDYFESAYRLDTFAKFCQKEHHFKLLKDNITHLNEYYQNSNDYERNFKLLKDADGNYIRAITSVSHYNNYGNRFSLFVAVMSLKTLMSSKNLSFKINRAEYDESSINVFFEKIGLHNIKGIGQVKFMIEMSNDEIKRAAMKFSAVFSIVLNDIEIYLKPQKLKTELISIGHNFVPNTVFEYLSGLNDFIEKAEAEVIYNIGEFAKVKNADELRFSLLRKVETTKNNEVKEHKITLRKLLENKINSISELLILMNKVDFIVSSLETKEYLRYLFYDILKGKK